MAMSQWKKERQISPDIQGSAAGLQGKALYIYRARCSFAPSEMQYGHEMCSLWLKEKQHIVKQKVQEYCKLQMYAILLIAIL